jgi:hypothetical protein
MEQHANQAPNLTHANAASICAMALKAMGLDAERALDFRDGYDFLVDRKVRIAVRYAIPTSDREQIYKKRNGDISHYLYKRWTFNFHRHGKIDERYCDFFVCFLAAPISKDRKKSSTKSGSNGSSSSDVTVFVIPWEAITGLTFCSSVREGSSRSYRGKYSVYRDSWNLIAEAASDGFSASGLQEPRAVKTLRISADSRRRLRLVTSEEEPLGVPPKDEAGRVVTIKPGAFPRFEPSS